MEESRLLRWTYSVAGVVVFLLNGVAGFLAGVIGVGFVWMMLSGAGLMGLIFPGRLGWATGWQPFAVGAGLVVVLVAWRRLMSRRHPDLRYHATGDRLNSRDRFWQDVWD